KHERDPNAEKVYQDVLKKSTDAGGSQPEAEQNARIQSAFFEVAAKKFKTDAWALYQPYGLRIQQEIPGLTRPIESGQTILAQSDEGKNRGSISFGKDRQFTVRLT